MASQNEWGTGEAAPAGQPFQNDATDFWAVNRPPAEFQLAEQRLMAEILEQAVQDLQPGLGVKKQVEALRAMEWVLSDARDWVFAFRIICEAMGYAPEWIRRELVKRWEADHGYAPTPEALEQRRRDTLALVGHAFVAVGHCASCTRRNPANRRAYENRGAHWKMKRGHD